MEQTKLYDAVIVGGGPAGLTAAIYLARAKYRVLVIEKEHWGGQITITSEVVNYPGVERTSGTELTSHMRKQAEQFGAEFLFAEVSGLKMAEDIKEVRTTRGTYSCFAVLLATGAHPRMLGFQGEEEFRGRGVAYCATCDGEFFTGKDIFVVGGGFAAAEESVFLTKYGRKVTILIREDDFTCAKSVADHARRNEKIEVITNVEVEEVAGSPLLNYIRYKNNKTGELTEFRSTGDEDFGVFVFAGYEPATSLIETIAQLDDYGYVVTDSGQRTSVEGLYAAGDVCVKTLRQVVTAVGDGALAATEMEKYAAKLQKKTGLIPERPQSSVKKEDSPKPDSIQSAADDGSLFNDEMKAQLQAVFERMERPMILELWLNDTHVAEELKEYTQQLASMSEKISVEIVPDPAEEKDLPLVRILTPEHTDTGLAFHGVPGGHEFTSFMLGLYNAAGPGQAMDEATLQKISEISSPVNMKVMVSLSCTMCPELVTAAQHIAAKNKLVTAEVYDLNHFPDIQKKYQVMSVPCLVINDAQVTFGKKNVEQILSLI